MDITITIKDARFSDILTSASFDYWGYFGKKVTRTAIKKMIAGGPPVEITEQGDEKEPFATHKLTASGLKSAIAIMAKKYQNKLREVLDEDESDAYTGDILIQLAVFGEEKYA